jgi:cold shock CspA family protein
MYGTLRKWNDERGFGFIELDGQAVFNRGVFVHVSAFKSRTAPPVGSLLRFDVQESDRGVKAIDCELVTGNQA